MLLLKQNTSRIRGIDENIIELDIGGNNKKYKIDTIWDNVVYTNELELGQLLVFYYLILYKGYFKEKNT